MADEIKKAIPKKKKKPAKKKAAKVSTTPESTKQQHAEWDKHWSGLSQLEKDEHLGKMHEIRHLDPLWENCNAFYSADDYARSEDTFIEYNEEY